MRREVLVSIRPKWCELIASRNKTLEVRKTRPKLGAPFKAYIYCTEPRNNNDLGLCRYGDKLGLIYKCNYSYAKTNNTPILSGKVIGEFVCDEITEFESEFWDDETYESIKKVVHSEDWDGYPETYYWHVAENGEDNNLCKSSCLNWDELRNYIGQGFRAFYGWHISDIVIYDEPKDLSDFYKCCGTEDCLECQFFKNDSCETKNRRVLKRGPQSWCYVEGVK